MKKTIEYNKASMQWLVKIGRLTIFATDNYETAKQFLLQHQADEDIDRLVRQINIIKENSFYGLQRKAGDKQ